MPKNTAQFKGGMPGNESGTMNEIQNQAKALLDWRSQVEKNPLAMLGVAFGGGLLLGVLLGDMGRSGSGQSSDSSRQQFSGSGSGSASYSQIQNILDQMKNALIGVASTKVVQFLDEMVPGFQEHYGKHSL